MENPGIRYAQGNEGYIRYELLDVGKLPPSLCRLISPAPGKTPADARTSSTNPPSLPLAEHTRRHYHHFHLKLYHLTSPNFTLHSKTYS
jgi:hypothetical protein